MQNSTVSTTPTVGMIRPSVFADERKNVSHDSQSLRRTRQRPATRLDDITRREPGAHDGQIDIAFRGVCHSDLHTVRADWTCTLFPCVPGHEIVGRVAAVGSRVTRHKFGDLAGVGCMVESCKHCEDNNDGLENYCDNMAGTYNEPTTDEPRWTMGG